MKTLAYCADGGPGIQKRSAFYVIDFYVCGRIWSDKGWDWWDLSAYRRPERGGG